MVTDQLNLKKTEIMFQCLSKKSFFLYCSQLHNFHVNTTVVHKVNKDNLCWICSLDIRTGSFKGLLSGSLKIYNCDRSNGCYVLLSTMVTNNLRGQKRQQIITVLHGRYDR